MSAFPSILFIGLGGKSMHLEKLICIACDRTQHTELCTPCCHLRRRTQFHGVSGNVKEHWFRDTCSASSWYEDVYLFWHQGIHLLSFQTMSPTITLPFLFLVFGFPSLNAESKATSCFATADFCQQCASF